LGFLLGSRGFDQLDVGPIPRSWRSLPH
jgi:hypothetical protein